MKVLLLVAVILIIGWLIYQYMSNLDDRTHVEAFDGRMYHVRNIPSKKETADSLARLNARFTQVMKQASQMTQSNPDLSAAMRRLQERYDPSRLSEAIVEPSLTSYTVDKGEEVALCMRTRDASEALYDDNLMMTVLCHEGAHIMSISIDHTPEFMGNFRFLLDVASSLGMYQPSNTPVNYCGLQLPRH